VQNRAQTLYRVVTGVQVHYERPGNSIDRVYTKPASMQSILTYLRILRPFGPVNPETAEGASCRITLQYSKGPDSVYLQQGQQYLQKDGGDWERIDTNRASLLYPLLLLLPSDN
jgi:hypothetical protein